LNKKAVVQPTKQQINLLTGYFHSWIADLGRALGDSGPWIYCTGIVVAIPHFAMCVSRSKTLHNV